MPVEQEHASTPTHVRHFAWNDDYIELLAHKLGLQSVTLLVDVGSGLGGLPGLFGLYMKPKSRVLGFDLDAATVEGARAHAAARPYSVSFEFAVADPHALPVPDGAADLAVCQHVLAQVRDPEQVLAELCRLVRSGGHVVAFEPNGRVQSLVADSVDAELPLDDRLQAVRYQLVYEAGKRARQEGDDSVGDRLPKLFREAGLVDIEVRLSDKSAALVPPYDTPEKRARVEELRAWPIRFEAQRDLHQARFLAGGGTETEFEAYARLELAQHERICEQLDAGTFVHPGGLLTYIVIARKP